MEIAPLSALTRAGDYSFPLLIRSAHQKAGRNLSLFRTPLSIHTDSFHSWLFNGFAVLHYVSPLRVHNHSLQLFFPCESGSEKQDKFN